MGEGRSGQNRPIPLVSVSIAVVTNLYQRYENINQIIDEATRVKKLQIHQRQHHFANDMEERLFDPSRD